LSQHFHQQQCPPEIILEIFPFYIQTHLPLSFPQGLEGKKISKKSERIERGKKQIEEKNRGSHEEIGKNKSKK
jgi:hypothetical protein